MATTVKSVERNVVKMAKTVQADEEIVEGVGGKSAWPYLLP